jgi:putative ABC transport system ATP-binding protein
MLLAIRSLIKTLSDGRRRFRVEVPAFTLASGERKAIVGRTGSGKTTVMDVLALASRPDSAETFELDGDGRTLNLASRLGSDALARLRSRHFGYVLQSSPLFPFLDVAENLALSQRLVGLPDPAFVAYLARRLDIDIAPGTRVTDLSVGQRQRVAVARALAHRPDFILCDEPTAALDPHTAETLLHTLIDVANQTGAAILMITHEPHLVVASHFEIFAMRPAPTQDHAVLIPLREAS